MKNLFLPMALLTSFACAAGMAGCGDTEPVDLGDDDAAGGSSSSSGSLSSSSGGGSSSGGSSSSSGAPADAGCGDAAIVIDCASPPPGCQYEGVVCVDGMQRCGALVCDTCTPAGGSCIAEAAPVACNGEFTNDYTCGGSALCCLPGDGGVVSQCDQQSVLAAEIAMVRAAQAALRTGQPELALRTFAEHARSFPSGALQEEREAGEVVTLCALGRAEGRDRARRFERERPRSLALPRIHAACRK